MIETSNFLKKHTWQVRPGKAKKEKKNRKKLILNMKRNYRWINITKLFEGGKKYLTLFFICYLVASPVHYRKILVYYIINRIQHSFCFVVCIHISLQSKSLLPTIIINNNRAYWFSFVSFSTRAPSSLNSNFFF